ncbi:CamS family sex pheromone protein [Scopulibacillus darangshiensis]|uniref:CamS family sex pheromone protein n=1 Tax=Scopulibacillus darangshiensis TaxID=442528 RepID=UPI001FB4D621|nr:CamS family sex pheromone protein [Scopulibacillus darangshiensis]
MLKKWLGLCVVCSMLILSACSFGSDDNKNKVIKNTPKGDDQKVTLIPQVNSKDYQSIQPKKPSDTRGYITYGVTNRTDIDELEMGLMRLSKDPFSPNDYVFQSGQYLTEKDINGMLYRKSKDTPHGLNPPLGDGKDVREKAENSPKILSYVLEQDYLKKSGKDEYKLGGVSLAISLNQVYADKVMDKEGKTYEVKKDLDINKVKQKGKEYAQEIVKRVRGKKGLGQVPIFVTLYLEAPPESLVPGHYFAKASVSQGSSSIGKWDKVDSEYILFPSSKANKDYKSDADIFNNFKKDVEDYFPNFIGVIGKGFYKGGELDNLTFDISIKFYDKTEVVGFTNYVASLLQNNFPFPGSVPVQIYIKSANQPEAVIVKKPDQDKPFVHIYRQ